MEIEHPESEISTEKWHRRLAWSGLKALSIAVVHLILLRGLQINALLLFGLPPTVAVLCTDPQVPRWSRRIAWSFLVLIGAGAIVSKVPPIFPRLGGMGADLSPEHDRLLVWYAAVYLVFLLGVLPVFLFGGSLRRHWRQEPAFFSRFTCYLGLLTAGLLMLAFPAVLDSLGFWPVFAGAAE